MSDLKAYACVEDYENRATVIFAKSNIEARKAAAREFDMDGIAGLSVTRAPGLDEYAESGLVPAKRLVADGWSFECANCGQQVCDYTLDEIGLSVDGVVGYINGWVFCSHQCRIEYKTERAAVDAYGEAFLDMLKDMVRARFPWIQHNFGEFRHHVYARKTGENIAVEQAIVRFDFPGRKYAAASIEINHCGKHGRTLIGPVRPEYRCSNGDKEAFEVMANGEYP